MARSVSAIAKELEMHSDIALGLLDHALDDLIRAIDKHGQEVWQQGYNDGLREAAHNNPTGAGL